MDLFVRIQPFYSLSAAAYLNAWGLFFCFCGTFLFIHQGYFRKDWSVGKDVTGN